MGFLSMFTQSQCLQFTQEIKGLFGLREGKGRGGREGFNISLFGLIRIKEGNGREGKNLMIICLVKEGREM